MQPSADAQLVLQARLKNPGVEDLWLAAVRTELRAEKKKDAEALIAKALQVAIWAAILKLVFPWPAMTAVTMPPATSCKICH